MAIFLKKIKIQKKGKNLVHKGPNLTTIIPIQCKLPESNADMMNKRIEPKKRIDRLPKMIGAIISSACGRRKETQGVCSCAIDEPKKRVEESAVKMFKGLQLSMNESRSSDKIQVDARGKNCKRSSSLSSIFSKKTSFRIRRQKSIKTDYATVANGIQNTNREMKPVEKIKREEKTSGEENGNGELELCKKRILLGEKCRALNSSGVLHYDEDGILLPEDFFSN